jgi:hypothetical protein
MAANKQSIRSAINERLRSPPLMLLTAIITLTIWLALVIGHNVWSGNALAAVVTAVGWLTLSKALAPLVLPLAQTMVFCEALQYDKLLFVCIGVTFAFGLYLTISAFSA